MFGKKNILTLLYTCVFLFAITAHCIAAQDKAEIASSDSTLPAFSRQIGSGTPAAYKTKGQNLGKGVFEAFNASKNNRWKAKLSKKDGKVKILYGSLSKRYSATPEDNAKAFLQDSHEIFGLRKDLKDLFVSRSDKTLERNHTRLQQTYNGIPVNNAFVLVHSNSDGQITMVQNDYESELMVANQRLINKTAAETKAVEDLLAIFGKNMIIGNIQSKELVIPYGDQYLFVWRIMIPTSDPLGLWVYRINEENAEILYKANEIVSLGKGKGKVYKNNKKWHQDKVKSVTLKNMFTTDDGVEQGWLWGSHADIYDLYGNDPYNPDLKFLFDPNNPTEKPWFDTTTAYYQINKIWSWWNNKVLSKYGPSSPDWFYTLSVATVVNVHTCNAFYTSDIGWREPGFFFGDENECAEGSEDLVLDQSIIFHEYTHAMMDWNGFDEQFQGEVDEYGRAMGEGNSDWFAYLGTGNPQIADVAFNWAENGYLRTLDNTRTYPDDVDYPDWGIPEEHYTGEIWGGYLYDISKVLGRKKALKYVYQSFFYFTPADGHRDGEPDFFDAIRAQMAAELDLTGQLNKTAKVWGAMASRGINGAIRAPYSHDTDYFNTGAPGSDAVDYFSWEFPPTQKISTKGHFFNTAGVTCNEYPVTVTAEGLDLSVIVTGSETWPTVTLYKIDETIIETASGTSKKTILTIPDIPSDAYVIKACGNNGKYKIKVKIR